MYKALCTQAFIALSFCAQFAWAQEAPVDVFAQMRQEINKIATDLSQLRVQATTPGALPDEVVAPDVLSRLDAAEAQLTRLIARQESAELRFNEGMAGAANRLGDLEFRLCELTPGCDIATLTPSLPLDTPAAPPQESGLAVSEQTDFDAATAALDRGDYQAAANGFTLFTQTYTVSPLLQKAQLGRAEALDKSGATTQAARAYLEAYASDPQSETGGKSLLRLGETLAKLGQTAEACVTLSEVITRHPATEAALNAKTALLNLPCN